MKVHVVFTGGTIGSTASGGVISPADSSKSVLLENYIALHGNDVSFEIVSPYFALSENLCSDNSRYKTVINFKSTKINSSEFLY